MNKPIRLSRKGTKATIDLMALRRAVEFGTLSKRDRLIYHRIFGEYPETLHPEWLSPVEIPQESGPISSTSGGRARSKQKQ